jgi:hypothetical protein
MGDEIRFFHKFIEKMKLRILAGRARIDLCIRVRGRQQNQINVFGSILCRRSRGYSRHSFDVKIFSFDTPGDTAIIRDVFLGLSHLLHGFSAESVALFGLLKSGCPRTICQSLWKSGIKHQAKGSSNWLHASSFYCCEIWRFYARTTCRD